MNGEGYRRKYPRIARLLHDTNMTYAAIGREVGFTTQYVHWLNKRLGRFGRPIKAKVLSIKKSKIADEAVKRFGDYMECPEK